MPGERIYRYFESESRVKRLNTLTFAMYCFLAVEKLISGAAIRYEAGQTFFDFSFSLLDVISLGVYIAMAVLVAVKVEHKFLLLPDFVLLGVKLSAAITGVVSLVQISRSDLLLELSLIETTAESILFSLFLIVLFCGKLIKTDRAGKICPILCLAVLSLCVPMTIGFEAVKVYVAESMYTFPVIVEAFNVLRYVINETFLDLPYALLVLLVFFTHKNEKQ